MPGKENARPLTNKTQKVSKAPKAASKADKERALFKAAGDGNLEKVVELLKEGVDANYLGYDNNTPLTEAAGLNHEKIVDILLQVENINVNAEDIDGRTALHWAVMKENPEMIISLLKNPRVDINAKNNKGDSAINSAVEDNNEEIVDIFLQDDRLEINYLNKNGITPLISAIFENNENIVFKILSFKGINVNIINEKGLSALSYAVDADNKNILKIILQAKGVDASVLTKEDWDKVYLAFPDYGQDGWDISNAKKGVGAHDASDKIHLREKLDGPEIFDEYEVEGSGPDYSSDTNSHISSEGISATMPEEDSIDSELIGIPLSDFFDA